MKNELILMAASKQSKDRARLDISPELMESLRKVNIYKDSRIDRGGCTIETDVGSIDARISTQLKEIEEAIRNAQPRAGK